MITYIILTTITREWVLCSFLALHKAVLQDESTNVAVEHVFAYVLWKKVHPFCDVFGVSSSQL